MMKAVYILFSVLISCVTNSANASEPLEKPVMPGVHGAYLYHITDTIEGKTYEQAAVLRREILQELVLRDTLIKNVIRDDIYQSIKLLEANHWLNKEDTTFYVIPLSTDYTHIAVCEVRYFDKNANQIVFAGYYKTNNYMFIFEKNLCNELGLLSGDYIKHRIIYGWDDSDVDASAYQPIVWYLSRDQRNNAILVSGPPRIKGYGSTRVVY